LTYSGSILTVINNSSPQAILLSRTSATARNWALGVDGDGAFRLTDTGTGGVVNLSCGAAGITFLNSASDLVFKSNNTEAMRIDSSSGDILVGTTSTNPTAGVALINNSTAPYILMSHASGTSSGTAFMEFNYNQSGCGSITQNGSSSVLYNTSSDYRLKENVAPLTTGLATVNALNPINFNWISDKRSDTGFLAHEFQSVIPNSVVGAKDAVDSDGKLVYQQMDNSGAIPYLVSAIKELSAQVTTLTTRLTALENK
jgi:hypothetical protein